MSRPQSIRIPRSHVSQISSFALVTLALVLVFIGNGRASDGRDFAGTYAITSTATESGGVRVSLTVQVQNYGDAAVSNATLRLEEFTSSGKPLGSFPAIPGLAANEAATVTADVLVPQEEYDRWQKGGTPVFSIEFDDNGGGRTRRPVETSQMFGGGQQ